MIKYYGYNFYSENLLKKKNNHLRVSFFFITSELFGPISHKIKPEIGQYYCGMAYSGLRSNNEKRAVVLICLMFVFDIIELVMS